LMFAARMTFAHLFVYSRMKTPNSSGVIGAATPPRPAIRTLIAASASPALIAANNFRRSVLRRPDPRPAGAIITRHKLSHRWDVRKSFRARGAGDGERAKPARFDVLDGCCHVAEKDLHLTTDQVCERLSFPAVRHMQHVEPGHALEQCPVKMWTAANPDGGNCDLAGIGSDVWYEL
jgi:hypothetical protein